MKSLEPKAWAHVENLRSVNKTNESNHLKGYHGSPQGSRDVYNLIVTDRELFLWLVQMRVNNFVSI